MLTEEDEKDIQEILSQPKKAKYVYDYPMAGQTADVVLFRKRPNRDYEVLLIQRKDDPFKNEWSLPGGFVNIQTELIIEAASRELFEETDVVLDVSRLKFVGYYDAIRRDPRGRTISHAFTAVVDYDTPIKAKDDAKNIGWKPIDSNRPIIAFDHCNIILDAIKMTIGENK